MQCVRSATIWVSGCTRTPYFVILWASLLFDSMFCSVLLLLPWVSPRVRSIHTPDADLRGVNPDELPLQRWGITAVFLSALRQLPMARRHLLVTHGGVPMRSGCGRKLLIPISQAD